jgi:hypothetical protein
MTNRIGNKDEAHQRGKEEKARIKASNIAQEAVKKAAAAAKYRNAVKGQPSPASTADVTKGEKKAAAKPATKTAAKPAAKAVKAKPAKPAAKRTTAAKPAAKKAAAKTPAKSSKNDKSHEKAGSDEGAGGGKKQEGKH